MTTARNEAFVRNRQRARARWTGVLRGQLGETLSRLDNARKAAAKGDTTVCGNPQKIERLEADSERLTREVKEAEAQE